MILGLTIKSAFQTFDTITNDDINDMSFAYTPTIDWYLDKYIECGSDRFVGNFANQNLKKTIYSLNFHTLLYLEISIVLFDDIPIGKSISVKIDGYNKIK